MIKFVSRVLFVFSFSFMFFVNYLHAQFESHPEVNWNTIETQHFNIVYHNGVERTAQVSAKICEEIYGPITALYNYEPSDKVNLIVSDFSDIANGATDYYGNRIEVFASALDFELRGTHNWLRNVITHEFTHMIQIQASLKFTKTIPAFYLQLINYEKERRPDVLYGQLNAIVSYPISGVGVPAWFAEGTAQYQRQQLGYDTWDSHRDMILRSYITDKNLMSWNEMGQFSTLTSLKAESIYNLGFALTRYIADKYGEEKLKKITFGLGDLASFSIDNAFEEHLGKDGKQIYNEWVAYLEKDYNERLSDVKFTLNEGNNIITEGFANLMPKYSPDGKKIAYLSNKESDFSRTALFVYDKETGNEKRISAPVSTNFDWSEDGNFIIYSKRNSPPTIDEAVLFDLYIYDTDKNAEKRISEELRAFSPSFSKDGKMICYVASKDGTLNLYIADPNGRNIRKLTDFNNGEQINNPIFSHDNTKIFFDYSLENGRKIGYIDINSLNIEFLIGSDKEDSRNPVITGDGKKLYYSSDATGIFNIYSYEIETKSIKQITNVRGGALMPSIDGNNNLTYANYTSDGYKIAEIKNFQEKNPEEYGKYKRPDILVKQYSSLQKSENNGKNNFDWKSLRFFDDKVTDTKQSKPYKPLLTQLSIFPLLRFDNYSKSNNILDAIKPGFYIYSDEIMTRFSLFGGFAMNRKFERDIFVQFDYDNGMPIGREFFAKKLNFAPKFSIAGYNVSRKADALLYAGVDTFSVGVGYDLLAVEVSSEFKLINYNHNFRLLYTLSKYSSSIDGFVLPQSGIFVRASSQDYFKAHSIALEYFYESIIPTRHMDINPVGRKVNIRYEYESSDINPELLVDDNGNVSTTFTSNKLHKIDATWREGISLFNNHSLTLKTRGAIIFGPTVDNFYDFYASGIFGMRGYPFFALGGGKLLTANLTYRFPLISNIDTRISPLYLDKLYFSIFADYGNAWNGPDIFLNDFKKDIGAELRLQAFSSYVFPTSIFVSAAYGFDKFTRTYIGKPVTYGKEVRLYFGMLFGFDI